MITCFKFKDMIDIAYHSNTDTLYLSLSDSWLQENSLFKNSKDYMLEYEKRTTDNKEDLENNIVSIILKLYHEEDFCYISGCYIEHFISNFNKKIGVYDYDWDSYLRVFKKQPLLKFAKLMIDNSDDINDEYAVISCLYTLCNGLSVPLVTESGFKLEKITM